MKFDELSMTEFKGLQDKDPLVILPVGSIEEHGSHLPLCTDSIQAQEVCERVAKELDALVLQSRYICLFSSSARYPDRM